MNLNKVILAGRLTRDPESNTIPSNGKTVTRISIAINRKWKTEAGESKEDATFIDCDAFGRIAETLSSLTHKGSELIIEGRIKSDSWTDKITKEKRYKMIVHIENFQLGPRPHHEITNPT